MSDTPFDPGPFIAAAKRELKANNNVKAHFEAMRDAARRRVDAITDTHAKTGAVVPEVSFDRIRSNSVSDDDIAAIRSHGCVIVRGVFDAKQAEDWNAELGSYLATNEYEARAKEKAGLDNYFGDLKDAKPQIFGVYWSKPQVQARQAESMAATKRFLNGLWDTDAPAGQEFDPNHDYSYADRTRRRAPGDTTLGLSPHMDAGSYERWVDPAFQKIYADVFAGRADQYDPWRAAYRTQTREFSSPAVSSMFRTFQGWTALTEQGPGDGTLELLPMVDAIGYVLLRALQDDVPEDELCLARPGRALGVDTAWHGDIMPGIVPIQTVAPGDTVWWHPDVVHAVGNEHNGDDFASVIYIGASPACGKNRAYALRQSASFLSGRSAPDFAAEDYEVNFEGRATASDLTELGRAQLALDA
ncbi:MAG: YbiU family protein [Pseudomonadota bacterium]